MRKHQVSIELCDHFVRWSLDYISFRAKDSQGQINSKRFPVRITDTVSDCSRKSRK